MLDKFKTAIGGWITAKLQSYVPPLDSRKNVLTGSLPPASSETAYLVNAPFSFVGRQSREYHNIDFSQYQNYPSNVLIKVLMDIDPDLSSAVWMLLRVANTGGQAVGKKTNGKPSKDAQRVLDDLVLRFNNSGDYNGYTENRNLYSITNELMLSAYTQGAACGMLGLDNKYMPYEFQTIDPYSIDFKFNNGQFMPHQNIGKSPPEPLDYANFLYVPVDNNIGDPYGRNPVISFLSVVFFRIGVLKDLQKVIRNQGWPRIKVKVLEEVLINNAPPNIKRDPKALSTYITDRMSEIKTMYENLRPDSSIIHLDSSEPGYLELQHTQMLDVSTLIEVLNSLIINSLKTTKTAIGKSLGGGGSEGYTSAEMTMYIKSVEGFRNIIKTLYDRMFTLAIHLSGVQGYAEWEWNPIELRSPKEMAQFEQVHIDNTLRLVSEGYISDEEASMRLVGHEPTGEARPLMSSGGAPDVNRPSTSDAGAQAKRDAGRKAKRSSGTTV